MYVILSLLSYSHGPSANLMLLTILYLSILLHAILNSLFISESVSNATNYFFFLPLSFKTQNVSALDGHLQVSQYVETATLQGL
jgi:hypothetical protein